MNRRSGDRPVSAVAWFVVAFVVSYVAAIVILYVASTIGA